MKNELEAEKLLVKKLVAVANAAKRFVTPRFVEVAFTISILLTIAFVMVVVASDVVPVTKNVPKIA